MRPDRRWQPRNWDRQWCRALWCLPHSCPRFCWKKLLQWHPDKKCLLPRLWNFRHRYVEATARFRSGVQEDAHPFNGGQLDAFRSSTCNPAAWHCSSRAPVSLPPPAYRIALPAPWSSRHGSWSLKNRAMPTYLTLVLFRRTPASQDKSGQGDRRTGAERTWQRGACCHSLSPRCCSCSSAPHAGVFAVN